MFSQQEQLGEAWGKGQERGGLWVSTSLQLPERREPRIDRRPTKRREVWLSPNCRSIPLVAWLQASSSGNCVINGPSPMQMESADNREEQSCSSRLSLGSPGRMGKGWWGDKGDTIRSLHSVLLRPGPHCAVGAVHSEGKPQLQHGAAQPPQGCGARTGKRWGIEIHHFKNKGQMINTYSYYNHIYLILYIHVLCNMGIYNRYKS